MAQAAKAARHNRTITVDFHDETTQIPPDLVVKSQVADIIDSILQLIRCPNGVYRACRKRKSRGALLAISAVQLTTTKCDGV